MSESTAGTTGPIIVKKYANRRLYNTQTSSYVTLDHLAQMVKEGVEFEVRDARTGADITRSVLAQIIFEEESKGQHLLPIKFLRQVIGFYGDSLQTFLPSYLEMSMESFTRNQGEMRQKFTDLFSGRLGFKDPGTKDFENLTRQNLEIFERAMSVFSPAVGSAPSQSKEKTADASPSDAEKARDEELRELKAQLMAMRDQIAQLAQKK